MLLAVYGQLCIVHIFCKHSHEWYTLKIICVFITIVFFRPCQEHQSMGLMNWYLYLHIAYTWPQEIRVFPILYLLTAMCNKYLYYWI